MELWIRSQDKECLMKVDRLDYDLSNYKHRIMINGYQTLVAEYETKKRALEILDEIEKTMMSRKGILTTLNKKEEFIPFENQVVIYEMPKE